MKWIIIAWDQIRLNKKISIILVVFITMSIFLIGVICIWRILTAGFAEQNGRNAKLNGRITFDY